MGRSIDRRLDGLEQQASVAEEWEVPVDVRVLTKAVARHQARENGEELPAYTQDELAALREEDLETVAGGGVVGHLRDSPVWRGPEECELLAAWESDARRRLEQAAELPPERWREVWGVDDRDERWKRDT
jgi:hypothetical protein